MQYFKCSHAYTTSKAACYVIIAVQSFYAPQSTYSLSAYTIVALVERITDRDCLYLFCYCSHCYCFCRLATRPGPATKGAPRSGAVWQSRLSVIPLHCIQISLSLLMPTRFHNVSSLFSHPACLPALALDRRLTCCLSSVSFVFVLWFMFMSSLSKSSNCVNICLASCIPSSLSLNRACEARQSGRRAQARLHGKLLGK